MSDNCKAMSMDLLSNLSSGTDKEGLIFDIQKFSINDGPGIRTTVFLKGCPLHCPWCHNPEGINFKPEIMFFAERCSGCLRCLEVCPNEATYKNQEGKILINREKCTACGKCVEVCWDDARRLCGKWMTIAEVFKEIEKDIEFYKNSGGGVTLSGGEPLAQARFSQSVLLRCKDAGIHTAIDISGFAPWESIVNILPVVDLVLFDLKTMDENKHRQVIGVSNDLILRNAQRIDDFGVPMIMRIPIVPGFNNGTEDIESLADFIRSLKEVVRVDLLPYHRLGVSKYERLARPYPLRETNSSKLEEVVRYYKEILEKGKPNIRIQEV